MIIHFFLRFHTNMGQRLAVSGNIPMLGDDDPSKAFILSYFDNEYWEGNIEVNPNTVAKLKYSYLLLHEDGVTIPEGGNPRTIDLSKTGLEEMEVIDTWCHAGEYENVFYTAPFLETLLKENETRVKIKSPKNFTHIFRIKAPLLQKNEVVSLLGNSDALSNWNTQSPIILEKENDWWSCKLHIPETDFPLSYKYGVFEIKEKEFKEYEGGPNRQLNGNVHSKKLTVIHDGFIHLPNNTWNGAGVSIPVFSLRSRNSFGTGEFADLKYLVDWAKKTGLKLIQLLPINDTTATHTWKDSYPYAAISTFALHPIYLNIEQVAGKKFGHIIKPLKKKQRQLNELPEVDYEQSLRFKLSTLKELFFLQKEDFLKDKDFIDFFEKNRDWLIPYASFCYLRDRNGTADFTKWKMYSSYDKNSIEKYVSPKARHYEEIALQYFLQFHLHVQLRESVEYAHKNGIILKGDLAIGVYRHSVDAWMQPELFHLEHQAGAPPDSFAIKGQNWGFPTYNWEKMAADGFAWWKRRFVQMSSYFDAFRVDHILGFFRIWSIPYESVEGIMGYFVPAIPVHIHEFSQRGAWFNYYRLCRPFINDAVLWEMFGPNSDKFREFLVPTGNGNYELKEAFNTQRKVSEYFSTLASDIEHSHLRQGLFDLISNIILFEHPGSNGQEFHFRFFMEHTISFRHLDWNMQQQLRELYIDYFYRRQEWFWKKEGLKKLAPLKHATNMLICGEDLGMVPVCVPEVMRQLGILSLEIQRMPKDNAQEFFNPHHAPYLSVVTPSTHDMSTIRGWWEEDRDRTQRFYNNEMGQPGAAPAFCESWISKVILLQHLYSPAIWSIFQLQDLLGMDEEIRTQDPEDERINIPADPKHYWRYRMNLYLEDLVRRKDFNEILHHIVRASGR